MIGEYDRNESSPFFRLEEAMGKKLWTTEWSRKNVIGDRKVISTTTPEKMRYIRDLYYVPNNSVLIITGDVNPAAAFALAEKIFTPRLDSCGVQAAPSCEPARHLLMTHICVSPLGLPRGSCVPL